MFGFKRDRISDLLSECFSWPSIQPPPVSVLCFTMSSETGTESLVVVLKPFAWHQRVPTGSGWGSRMFDLTMGMIISLALPLRLSSVNFDLIKFSLNWKFWLQYPLYKMKGMHAFLYSALIMMHFSYIVWKMSCWRCVYDVRPSIDSL